MKKLIVLLALVCAAGISGASELWWQVNPTMEDSSAVPSGDWDSARVYYFNSSDTSLAGQYGTRLDGVASADALEILDYATSTLPNRDLSAYSFYVELYNHVTYDTRADHSDAYRSAAVTYSALQNAINQGGTSYGTTPYEFSGFTAQVVPEPTSGLLVLLGAMALGLRRKRV